MRTQTYHPPTGDKYTIKPICNGARHLVFSNGVQLISAPTRAGAEEIIRQTTEARRGLTVEVARYRQTIIKRTLTALVFGFRLIKSLTS